MAAAMSRAWAPAPQSPMPARAAKMIGCGVAEGALHGGQVGTVPIRQAVAGRNDQLDLGGLDARITQGFVHGAGRGFAAGVGVNREVPALPVARSPATSA